MTVPPIPENETQMERIKRQSREACYDCGGNAARNLHDPMCPSQWPLLKLEGALHTITLNFSQTTNSFGKGGQYIGGLRLRGGTGEEAFGSLTRDDAIALRDYLTRMIEATA